MSIVVGLALAAIASAQEADLTLTKVVSDFVASPDTTLTYTLTVENLGPDVAANIAVVDPLPPNAVFASASPECSYEELAHEVTCLVPEMGPGMILEFVIDVVADVLPADAEIGVALTGEAPMVGQPAAALVGTRTDDHELITVDDQLVMPRGLAREAGGALLVADLVDPSTSSGGTPVTDGRIIRIDRATGAQNLLSSDGELLNPTGIAVDGDGRIFVADPTGPVMPEQFGRVIEIDPVDGSQLVLAEGDLLEQPVGVAVLDTGNLIVADAVGKLVRIDPATGDQTLVSEYGDLVQPRAVAQLEPEAVVVVDGFSGLVRVELASGEQTVLAPIDGVILWDPLDVEVDHVGHCWVADFIFNELGAVLHIDPANGELIESFAGDEVWALPKGVELLDLVTNRAVVSSTTTDPDPSNNGDWVATEIEEGYQPAVEVAVSETVMVTDDVSVDVQTVVVIEVLETITVTDAVVVLPAILLEVSETVVVNDVIVAQPAVTIDLMEAVTVSDVVTATPLLPVIIEVTETVTVGDQVVAFPPVEINLTEVVNVSDSVLVQPLLPVEIQITESITVSDQVVVTPAAMITVAEMVHVTDTPQVTVQAIVTIDVNETVMVSDQVGLRVDTPLFIDGFESGDTSAWSSTTGG